MNNISCYNKDQCYGCTSCSNICPIECIQMEFDIEGFLYPVVDTNKCIQCGKCIAHCPISNNVSKNNVVFSYGLVHSDKSVTGNSASGGAFTAFAEVILSNNGRVYGCAFNENIEATTTAVSTFEELQKLRGSKYVQCNNNNQFSKIKQDLDEGKDVLFISTPCFVAGLKSYLKCDYENLYLLDLFCHGVPSPKLFKSYINWLENKHKGKVEEFSFRDKKFGWGTKGHYIVKGKEYILYGTDPYYSSFLSGKIYRPTCYKCEYACSKRPGDVSIGDFWGVEKFHPSINRDYGVSAVLVNNEKGKHILSKINKRVLIFETEFHNIADTNKQLVYPTIRPAIRDEIYNRYNTMSFNKFVNKYLYFEPIIFIKIKRLIPQRIKDLLRKLINKK